MTRTTYFRILVQERRWTAYEAFLIQFHRAGLELARRDGDTRLATLPLSERQFMRWMTGDIKGLPRSYTCRILEHLFGLSVDELFADPPADTGTRSADAPPATAGGSGKTLVAWDRPDDVIQQTRALLTTNTDPALLQMAEESISSVVARYELLGPKQLVGETQLLRRMLHTLLAGHQLADQRRWLLGLAARTAGLLGYMAVNAGRPEAAEAYCTEALALADQIQDTGLQMWVLGTRSLSLYYLGRYAESDAAAAAGVALAPTDPQAIRLLSNGRARALARLGDQRQTRRAIGQALELSDRQQQLPTGITPCISFVPYSLARTLANAVTAYLSAGDVPQVLAYAAEIDELVERSESQWTRALVGLDVATALLRQGSPDLEQAMALGREALRAGGATPIRSVWQRAHELLEQGRSVARRTVGARLCRGTPGLGLPAEQRCPVRGHAEHLPPYGEPVTPQLAHDNRAFPADPPAALDDPVVVTAHDWAAFRRVERMTDHWDRPGWVPGHRGYYWMLTFPAAGELAAEARACQAGIAHLGLDPVPQDGLHVTLNKIGNCRDVAPRAIDDLARIAAGAVGPAFRMLAHPLAGSRGAVRCSVTPWTPLVQLYAALAAAGQDLGVPGGKPVHAFRPHLGIAYSNRDCPAEPVVEAVAALRGRAAVPVEVARVDLVELRREGAAYRWRTLHGLPLQAAASPAGRHGGTAPGRRPTAAC